MKLIIALSICFVSLNVSAGACLNEVSEGGLTNRHCTEYESEHSYLIGVYREACEDSPSGTWVESCVEAKYGCKKIHQAEGAEQNITHWFLNGESKTQISRLCDLQEQTFVRR